MNNFDRPSRFSGWRGFIVSMPATAWAKQIALFPLLCFTLCFVLLSAVPTLAVAATTSQTTTRLVVGAGCFWGVEKRFEAIPGVIDVTPGYAGGDNVAGTYAAVTHPLRRLDPSNHAEVVAIDYDPAKVGTTQLLQAFFEMHDPTQGFRQGNDVGSQYRSIVLYQSVAQQQVALQLMAQYQALLTKAGFGAITTEVIALKTFYPAEEFHQDYLAKNPNGYCPDHQTGVRFPRTEFATQTNSMSEQQASSPQPDSQPNTATATAITRLQQGRQLLFITADGYCPYCEQLKKDVLAHYRGDVPYHEIRLSELFDLQQQGLVLKSKVDATPTLIYLENGNEKAAIRGYLDEKRFYQWLGAATLGDSEAYEVAFGKSTDARFCKQYAIFNNTPDGLFIDKLSGDVLFDTRDRFDSGTGWLSFTKAVAGSTLEKPDYSYGMVRTEVIAKRSGIHLGHVFDDGPNGQRRFCINATVLEFKPRP